MKLSFVKSADKKTVTKKTEQQLENILEKMDFNKKYKTSEIAKFIDVKETRARTLLKELVKQGKIKAIGKNKGRRYIRE